ncbi:MAG TPA: ferrochelatase [SAR86 cluster bacterium]|nr:ferrochelatase [SAR86 cluster bacterium]
MKGILLVNLGSPKNLEDKSIKEYLREFLSDDLVIDYPKWIQQVLVNWIIVPNRYKKTQEAHSKIWTEEGSPLINNTIELGRHLAEESSLQVEAAMRYQEPSIDEGLKSLINKGCSSIQVIPLYPHYAISSSLTTKNKVIEAAKDLNEKVDVNFVEPFYNNPEYIDSLCSLIKEYRKEDSDLLLFSYHGIPIRHLRKANPNKKHNYQLCKKSECISKEFCYRHQVYETSRLCAEKLNIPKDQWKVSFQSRIGPGWLKPFTDKELNILPGKGIKRVDVISPSFIIDNLETLEEINIEGRQDFLAAGGEEFNYIPCLNSSKDWVEALNKISKR